MHGGLVTEKRPPRAANVELVPRKLLISANTTMRARCPRTPKARKGPLDAVVRAPRPPTGGGRRGTTPSRSDEYAERERKGELPRFPALYLRSSRGSDSQVIERLDAA